MLAVDGLSVLAVAGAAGMVGCFTDGVFEPMGDVCLPMRNRRLRQRRSGSRGRIDACDKDAVVTEGARSMLATEKRRGSGLAALAASHAAPLECGALRNAAIG